MPIARFDLRLPALACLVWAFNASAQDSLSDAVAAAQSKDPALQSASLNREAARQNIWIAGSRLLPQLTYQETRQNTNQTTTQDTIAGPVARDFTGQSYNKQLSLRQGVIRARDVEGYRQGHMQFEYGDQKYMSAQADLWSRATGAWLDVLAARSLVDVYMRAVQSANESAQQEIKRYKVGDGTKDSRAEALAQLAQAKAMLLDSELNLKARERAYMLLTGLPSEGLAKRRLPTESAVKFDGSQRDELWSLVLSTAPELRAARATQNVSLSRANQALYDHLPTLDLVASASSAQNDSANTLGYRYTNRQVGAQLVVPLFSGGGVEASRRQAVASHEASVADGEALLMRVETQFMADWASQAGLLERAQAARSLVVAAQEQRRAAELGLAKGLRTWTELSNADLLLARRSSDLVNLQVSLFKTQARILSLLPIQVPAWDEWVKSLDSASQQGQ
jgi:protease secretion system outer membrane protein